MRPTVVAATPVLKLWLQTRGNCCFYQLRFDFSKIVAIGHQVAELAVLLQSCAYKYFKFDFIGLSWNL